MDRSAIIKLRVTPAEKATIERRAKGQGVSRYARAAMLGKAGSDRGGSQAPATGAVDWAAFDTAVHRGYRRVPLARALREAREELGL